MPVTLARYAGAHDDIVRFTIDASFAPIMNIATSGLNSCMARGVCRGQFQIFSYRRDKGQGETRLLGKRSVGVGGHISTIDEVAGGSNYLEGMRREIEEEVFLESGYRHECVGLINDDLTEVGKVHLGIVHIFDLDAPQVRPREQSIIQTGFATPTDLLRERDQFETWSQICLDHLFAAS